MLPVSFVSQLSSAVTVAKSIEDLVRPLLLLLQRATGLESIYLTRVDETAAEQQVLYSLNTKDMQIPEGLTVPWEDTLCKRALEEKQPFTDDASQCWGDSEAAKKLGICTYTSTPIYYESGHLFGTLCGASSDVKTLSPEGHSSLSLFGTLIQQYVNRERLIGELQQANRLLQAQSYRDPLTDLPNRRLILMEMKRALSLAARENQDVFIAFIDLDGFKQINDQFGHEIGDAFLIEVGHRLASGIRSSDFLGRLGGDEFVVIIPSQEQSAQGEDLIDSICQRLSILIQGRFELGSVTIDYPGASFGIVRADTAVDTPEDLLRRADEQMYRQKRARKTAVQGS